MKLFFLTVIMLTGGIVANGQRSIYDYEIETIDGSKISMASFKGNKILIAAASPDVIEQSIGKFLDSLQQAYPSTTIIAIPTTDFGGSRNLEIMSNEKAIPGRRFIITALVAAKKDKGPSQHPLCRWLSTSSLNVHFEADVAGDQQFYVISESGILYSVLEKGVPAEVITTVLRQGDVKE